MKKLIHLFLLGFITLAGRETFCAESYQKSMDEDALQYRRQTLDDSKLYWCIDLISTHKIRRGMPKDDLLTLFGDSLKFNNETRTAQCILTSLKKDYSGPPIQVPAPWLVRFTFDGEWKLADYSITRAKGK